MVFDGQGGKVTEETEPGGIQVFYSGAGQTADDVIERFVATYGSENEISVATDDMLEQQTAITFGAHCVSAAGLKELLEETQGELARALKARKSETLN